MSLIFKWIARQSSLEKARGELLCSISRVEAVRDPMRPDFGILIEMRGRFNPITAIQVESSRLMLPAALGSPVTRGAAKLVPSAIDFAKRY